MIKEDYRPTMFWAWNGEMTDEEIKSEIKSFYEAGIGGLHLHARAGLTIEYLGEEWMHACHTAINTCKQLGMSVWIYDEQGWPSGFCGGRVSGLGEEYVLKHLISYNKYKENDNRLLACYKMEGNGYKRTYDKENGDLFISYEISEFYVDLLSKKVADAFIESTHEVYKKHFSKEFGKTIKGVFTDEPQIHVSALAYSFSIADEYKKTYKEDVFDKLYLLFTDSDESKEFRFKYYSVVRKLFVNNYTKTLYDWCEQNNLLLTGHFAGEDGLCVQVASNTGVMPHYEYMQQPGIDYLGRRFNPPLIMKQVQSVASQLDKKRILCELYACTGNGVSFRELSAIWFHLASFDVNFPCMSIAMHSLGGVRKRDYPVFVSPQQPWWKEFSYYTKFMNNVSELASYGERKADVLLISAINGVLKERIFTDEQKIISASYRKTVESLIDLQINFDIGDEELIRKYGKITDGNLNIGKGRYKIVIIPKCTNILTSTLLLLEEFARLGGEIVYIENLPEYFDGVKDYEKQHRLEKITKRMLQERKGIIKKYFTSVKYDRKITVTDYQNRLYENIIVNLKETDYGYNMLVFNNSSADSKELYLSATEKGYFNNVDIMSGCEEPVTISADNQISYAKLNLEAYEGRIIRFYKADKLKDKRLKEDNLYSVCEIIPQPYKIDENALTIDYAQFRINGGSYSDKMPLVWIQDKIYKKAEEEGKSKVIIKYDFNVEDKPDNISLVAETLCVKKLTVNNTEIAIDTDKYYIDRSFRRYDIKDIVKKGNNEVLLEFDISPLNLGYDLEEVHDSVRNKFSYPIETENIYIVGDFDVVEKNSVIKNINCIFCDGDFVIRKKGSLHNQLTENGKPFYAGKAYYKTTINCSDKKTLIAIDDYNGTAVEVKVNGNSAGLIFLAGQNIDITRYIKSGENQLEFILSGTIRNLLGPHHHPKGEVEFTGIHTFTGGFGNGAVEDLSSDESDENTWTDKYSFIPFGLNKIKVITVIK